MPKRTNKSAVVPSSGNVFADLGVINAEEKQTKVRLAVAINQIIQGRKLSQTAAARRLKINQPKVSALSNYQLDGFSVERLMKFVTALDSDVDIVIRPKSRKIGRICASRKFGAAQGSKLFFQMTRKGRWACGPSLNLVNQIRCDVHLCASTLRTRKSESQYRQGLILARSGSPSFVAVVQSADKG